MNMLVLLRVWFTLFVASCTLLTGCNSTYLPVVANSTPTNPLPKHVVYVLAGRGSYNDFANNSLTIIDAETWQVYRRVPILRSRVKNFNRDPFGRIWIGYSGGTATGDNRVQIYTSEGDLISTINTCLDPEAGISFSANRAFIACSENGFEGSVDVIGLDTLVKETNIRLAIPGDSHLLITSAANNETVVISGNGYLTRIDPVTLTIQEQIGPFNDRSPWQIIPHEGKFYMLNKISYRSEVSPPNDVVVLTPSLTSTISNMTFARSPLWGDIYRNTLYTFHNPTWSEANSDTWRAISKTDLISGVSETWDLPEINADDLVIVNQKIIISLWWADDGSKDGLYEFIPETGELKLLVNSVGAEKIIVVDQGE